MLNWVIDLLTCTCEAGFVPNPIFPDAGLDDGPSHVCLLYFFLFGQQNIIMSLRRHKITDAFTSAKKAYYWVFYRAGASIYYILARTSHPIKSPTLDFALQSSNPPFPLLTPPCYDVKKSKARKKNNKNRSYVCMYSCKGAKAEKPPS